MSNFYLSDPNIVINGNIKPLEYRIYSYCCSQFNVKKMSAFIRIVNIGGQFQKTKEEVEEILISLSKIRLYEKELISIKDGPKYIIFDMPAHKYFLTNIGFKQYKSYKGWKALGGYLKQRENTGKVYLYPNLDQYELLEKLQGLPPAELAEIKKKPDQLRYPWMLRSVD